MNTYDEQLKIQLTTVCASLIESEARSAGYECQRDTLINQMIADALADHIIASCARLDTWQERAAIALYNAPAFAADAVRLINESPIEIATTDDDTVRKISAIIDGARGNVGM